MRFMGFGVLIAALVVFDASAYEYNFGSSTFKLNANGMFGAINPDFGDPLGINDWRVRAQYSYDVSNVYKFGLMYSMDASSFDRDRFARDAFLFVEDRNLGRFEIGLTDSVAKKMGLGLPDVGGMRVNDRPLFYKKINPSGNVISDVSLSTDRYAPRVNFVSQSNRGVQYGLSVAGLTNKYNFTTDAAVKIRRPRGKTKTAFTFGASFMDGPENFQPDTFSSPVTADWRAQFSAAMNLQYNSWIWGVTARAIYDRNPIGPAADGVVAGTGLSYDLLKYTISASYLLSDTGIWDDTPNNILHTGLLSFRYKYTENVSMWMSVGITGETSFFGVGIGGQF